MRVREEEGDGKIVRREKEREREREMISLSLCRESPRAGNSNPLYK